MQRVSIHNVNNNNNNHNLTSICNFTLHTAVGRVYSSASVVKPVQRALMHDAIGGSVAISHVTAGDDHALFVSKDGALYGWGANDVGQVGAITLASVNHARFCQSHLLLSITLASVNHALFCQSRSLLSITLASVTHARFCQSRSLLSITLASVNHARLCQSCLVLLITLACVNHACLC
jgi:hypothetical protein